METFFEILFAMQALMMITTLFAGLFLALTDAKERSS